LNTIQACHRFSAAAFNELVDTAEVNATPGAKASIVILLCSSTAWAEDHVFHIDIS
jgi:hypothetical protein